MPRYTDELDVIMEREQALRRSIALAIAEAANAPVAEPTEALIEAADEAIAAWSDGADEQHDEAAFRPLTPLQQLLQEHRAVTERIADTLDRRLS